MTPLALIAVLAYLVVMIFVATRLGRFLKGVERDARKHFKNK